MAESATIARPYAEAVFDTAAAAGDFARWSDLLAEMAALAANDELQTALANPRLTDTKRVELFQSLVKGKLDDKAKNLIAVLAANDRLALLPEMRAQYERLRAEREGVADAEITSAFALDAKSQAKLVAMLEKRFKRKIRPHVRVDAELIGGVHVQVGDEVIDASVRGKLAAMEIALQS